MHVIDGGKYEGREYGCMYEVNWAMYNQDRYDKENGLVGFSGLVNDGPLKGHEAMLYFGGNDVNNLQFKKGELYFAEIDKTYGELRKETAYDLQAFRRSNSQTQRGEGVVAYKGSRYRICAHAHEDTDEAWNEAVIRALADILTITRKTETAEA